MRLRNIPRAEGTIQAHPIVIKRPEDQRGCWRQVFGNKRPIRIEIGMGKGRFILNMAKEHPDINFIGIERYSSVLLRAVEKFDTEEFRELKNVRFVCMDARDIADVFAEISRIRGQKRGMQNGVSHPWNSWRDMRRCSRRAGLWNSRQIIQRFLISLWSRSKRLHGPCGHLPMTCTQRQYHDRIRGKIFPERESHQQTDRCAQVKAHSAHHLRIRCI